MSRQKFEFIKKYNNFNLWEADRLKMLRMAVVTNKRIDCQVCKKDGHQMLVQYLECRNEDCWQDENVCPKKIKIHKCLKSDKTLVFEHGDHNSLINSCINHGNEINIIK